MFRIKQSRREKAAVGIVAKLRRNGYEAYFAGGWARDFLLGRKAKDIDIVSGAPPDAVRSLFPNSKAIGAAFGVVQVRRYGCEFEVATFRRDYNYRDGRHPDKVVFSTAEEDATRRDFTINGLFYDPIENRLIDFVGGREDIRQKIVCAIGDASARFTEDKLRMLRAVRLACTLNFTIDEKTWAAVKSFASDILVVSQERIRDELSKILSGPDPCRGLDLLWKSGLLEQILPEAIRPQTDRRFAEMRAVVAYLRKPSLPLSISALLYPADDPAGIEPVCRRLKLSSDEVARVVDILTSREFLAGPEAIAKSDRTRLAVKPHIMEHLEFCRARLKAEGQNLRLYARWRKEIESLRRKPLPQPLIDGNDLIALGCKPGPFFKSILREIEDLQYEGSLTSRLEALRYVTERRQRDHVDFIGKKTE